MVFLPSYIYLATEKDKVYFSSALSAKYYTLSHSHCVVEDVLSPLKFLLLQRVHFTHFIIRLLREILKRHVMGPRKIYFLITIIFHMKIYKVTGLLVKS